jgi:hypothetical protein
MYEYIGQEYEVCEEGASTATMGGGGERAGSPMEKSLSLWEGS